MINKVKRLIVFAITSLATSVNTAMEEPRQDISTSTILSQQEFVDLERISQWSHSFPLIGGGSIIRIYNKGIFVNIADVHIGPDPHFEWLAGKSVFGKIPSKNVYLDMHMTQESFSATLEDAGILMKHTHSF